MVESRKCTGKLYFDLLPMFPSDPSFESFENGAVSHSEVLHGLWEPQRDAASGHNGCGNVVIAPPRACASDRLLAPPNLIDYECAAACSGGLRVA
jgi:hypothetical protein